MRPEATFVLAQCACAHPGHLRTPTYPTILGSRLLSRSSAAPLRVVNTNGTNLTLSMMRDGAEAFSWSPGQVRHTSAIRRARSVARASEVWPAYRSAASRRVG